MQRHSNGGKDGEAVARQHVRYVLCDRNHPDLNVVEGGPLCAVGVLHRTLNDALKMEGDYHEGNPQSFLAKVTYERVSKEEQKKGR